MVSGQVESGRGVKKETETLRGEFPGWALSLAVLSKGGKPKDRFGEEAVCLENFLALIYVLDRGGGVT